MHRPCAKVDPVPHAIRLLQAGQRLQRPSAEYLWGAPASPPAACGILPQCKAQGAPKRKPLAPTALIRRHRIWPFQARSLRPFGRMPNVAARMAALPAKCAADNRWGAPASRRQLAASCRNAKRRHCPSESRSLQRHSFGGTGFGLSRRVPYAHSAGCRTLPPGWRRSVR